MILRPHKVITAFSLPVVLREYQEREYIIVQYLYERVGLLYWNAKEPRFERHFRFTKETER